MSQKGNQRQLRSKKERQRRDRMNLPIGEQARTVPPVVASARKVDKKRAMRITAQYMRSQHDDDNNYDGILTVSLPGPEASNVVPLTSTTRLLTTNEPQLVNSGLDEAQDQDQTLVQNKHRAEAKLRPNSKSVAEDLSTSNHSMPIIETDREG